MTDHRPAASLLAGEAVARLARRVMLRGATGAALSVSPFLAAFNRAIANASCGTIPADRSAVDYTFAAAYAASPPAVDEVAFTLETENMMALTYGSDFMRYRPLPGQSPNFCGASMAAPGNEGVAGRWVERWEGSDDYKTWTVHIRPGIRSPVGNEMTADDIIWTWQRAFEMKAVRYFFAKAMFLEKPEDIEVLGKYAVRFNLSRPSPVILILMAMSYYGGPFDSVEAKKRATAGDEAARAMARLPQCPGRGRRRMSNDDPCWLGVRALARALRQGETTSRQVTRLCLDRIAALNPKLQAFITVTAESALAEAAAADAELAAGRSRGPLHGVPYTLKDIVQTAGVHTTAGSWTLRGWVPDKDATVVTRLRAAGAVLLGKVNTHEFAFGGTTQTVHGNTRNPWDLTRIAGGSSGAPARHWRRASARFRWAATRPTLVSAAGVVAQSYTSDHIGPMARSAGDLAVVMAAIAGPDSADPTCRTDPAPEFRASGAANLAGLRIGIPEELMRFPIAAGIARRFALATDVLRRLGAELRPVSIPLLAEVAAINNAIVPPETTAQHMEWAAGWFAGLPVRYGDDVASLLETARAVPATATILAGRARRALAAGIEAALATEVDLLVTPTQAIVAPLVGAARVSIAGTEHELLATLIHFLCPFSLAGVPALAQPIGAAEDGLPASLQLIGPTLGDPLMLAVGTALEEALVSAGEASRRALQ